MNCWSTVFSFRALTMCSCCLLISIVSGDKSALNYVETHSYLTNSCSCSVDLSLSSDSLTVLHLGVNLFEFMLLGVSQMCRFMSFIRFGVFSCCSSNIVFCHCLFSLNYYNACFGMFGDLPWVFQVLFIFLHSFFH